MAKRPSAPTYGTETKQPVKSPSKPRAAKAQSVKPAGSKPATSKRAPTKADPAPTAKPKPAPKPRAATEKPAPPPPPQTEAAPQAEASRAQNAFSAEQLGQWLPASRDADVYFLGPRGFMRSVKQSLKALGVPDAQVHYEFFGPAEALA